MSNIQNNPIGVFDSGIGGLTIVKNIMQHLPHENVVYFGDIARLPYGTKSVSTIRKFARQTVQFLLQQNVKAIVIACNTISAVARDEVQQLTGNIPVVDVISSGSRAISPTINQRIGIIGTYATVQSNAYPKHIHQLYPQLPIEQVACTLFVPFIEEGYINHPALKLVACEYLKPLLDKNIDTLILGCTHYPIISDMLSSIMGSSIKLIDPAINTTHELAEILKQHNYSNTNLTQPQYQFYVTELSQNFHKMSELFLNTTLNKPQLIQLD